MAGLYFHRRLNGMNDTYLMTLENEPFQASRRFVNEGVV